MADTLREQYNLEQAFHTATCSPRSPCSTNNANILIEARRVGLSCFNWFEIAKHTAEESLGIGSQKT